MTAEEIKNTIYSRTLLAERPSFLKGVASIFDFAGALHPRKHYSGAKVDAEAIQQDWLAVGDDLRKAMRQYERRA